MASGAGMNRLSWDDLFIGMIKLYAQRSACCYFKVGCLFVRNNHVLSGGYNGPPTGESHCIEVGCNKESGGQKLPGGSYLCRGGHAEMNAIANAANEGVNLAGSICYCTHSPCYDCSKILVNLGIVEYVYMYEYGDEKGNGAVDLFRSQDIKVRRVLV